MTEKIEKIDLLAELGVGKNTEPKTITLLGNDLKLRTCYTGQEVLAFHHAFLEEDGPEFYRAAIAAMSADTKARTEKFTTAVLEQTVAIASSVIEHMAVHAGLIDKSGLVVGKPTP